MHIYRLILHTCVYLAVRYVMYFFFHAEEGVDGETLLLLARCGTVEQYKACGLKTVTVCEAADAAEEVALY